MKLLKNIVIIFWIIIIGLSMSFPNGCIEESACYQCKKRYPPKRIEDLYNPSYEYTTACSDNEAAELEKKGWNCEGYSAPEPLSYRVVTLLAPSDKDKFVNLDDSLKWNDYIHYIDYNLKRIQSVTYDVYFGIDSIPSIVVSSNQTSSFYVPKLDIYTTYYWKIVAKDDQGESSESLIYSFKTKPEIIFDTFTDVRDEHVYKTLTIRTQTWMAENLAFEIPGKQITDDSSWYNSCLDNVYDAWCYYDNDKDSIGNIYGIIYQWDAAKEACPAGWHLSAVADWTKLIDELGDGAGDKLKEAGYAHWKNHPHSVTTNVTGFTALPGGGRSNTGQFNGIGEYCEFWTSIEANNSKSYYYLMRYYENWVIQSYSGKWLGKYVRCVKD